MSLTRTVVRQARRRMIVREILARAGKWLGLASIASLGLVAVEKLVGIGVTPWVLVAVPPVLAAGLAAVLGYRRVGSPLAAAVEVDERLSLKDKLSSALSLGTVPAGGAGGASTADPFVQLALADAEATSRSVDSRRAVPVRLDWWW